LHDYALERLHSSLRSCFGYWVFYPLQKIFEVIRPLLDHITYEIVLPPFLAKLHIVFLVSQLRKYVPDPTYVIKYDVIHMQEDLMFETHPMRIKDTIVAWSLFGWIT